jgi:hypothetical protein
MVWYGMVWYGMSVIDLTFDLAEYPNLYRKFGHPREYDAAVITTMTIVGERVVDILTKQ